ncbi:MAG TPA: DUF899 family protein [Stellaceae bacterium]|jgi:predicted dithiol-disulfide oxidoreductase (DUF899 family)|nr:DUF899 family protein [Stellaceae bacterium]
MIDRDTAATLTEYRHRIAELRREMRAIRAAAPPEDVQNYEFATPEGPRRLSDLFGDRHDLIMIHNMGASCPNCTLWADGYNGIYNHLITRAAFVISSPDPPQIQQALAAERGWRFAMVSHQGSSFAADMGFRSERGTWLPGISVFRTESGRIVRTSSTPCDIGDDFCALWHLLDLLPGGAANFRPQLHYR